MADNVQADGATPGQQENPQGSDSPTDATSEQPLSYDEWFQGQDETVQSIISDRMSSLEGALRSERTERKDLAKQLRETLKQLDESSDAAQQLETLSAQLEERNRQADFYEEATKLGCQNLRLAYLASQSDDLDATGVKENYPELFQQRTAARTNAGSGSSQDRDAISMNEYIRRVAGFS